MIIHYHYYITGTDEKTIVSIIGNRSNEQRQQLKLKFKSLYGRVSLCVCILYTCMCVYVCQHFQFNYTHFNVTVLQFQVFQNTCPNLFKLYFLSEMC